MRGRETGIAWVAITLAAMGIVAALLTWRLPDRGQPTPPPANASHPLGGPFDLVSQDGTPYTSERLRGRPFAIFFGFTQCPEVCPTTLNDLASIMSELGSAADAIIFLFVSIDPERDTPAALGAFLTHFDKRIVGLTGNPAEIASLADKFGAFYERVPTRHDYTMNHSTWMYLVSRDGRLADRVAYREEAASQLTKLRRIAHGR